MTLRRMKITQGRRGPDIEEEDEEGTEDDEDRATLSTTNDLIPGDIRDKALSQDWT